MDQPSLVVGLGNPGPKFQFTRHNMGFMALDWCVAQGSIAGNWKTDRDCEILNFDAHRSRIFFVKPTTFMNLSGHCVQRLLQFYKIDALTRLLVVQDDLDLEFGVLKFQKNRGDGGNNGIKSIHAELGHNQYARLKIGIGRPPHPEFAVADWVLSRFAKSDEDKLRLVCENAQIAISLFLEFGYDKAASLLPTKVKSENLP